MEITELRIGNLIKYANHKGHIGNEYFVDLDILKEIQEGIKYQPIPLTEEWLSKLGFGFVSHKAGQIYYRHRSNGWTVLHSYGKWHYSTSQSVCLGKELKYVHDLQNLFFSLIGDELELEIE